MKTIKVNYTIDGQLRFPVDLKFVALQDAINVGEKTFKAFEPQTSDIEIPVTDAAGNWGQGFSSEIQVYVLQGSAWVPMNSVLQKFDLPELLGWAVYFNGSKVGVK